MSAFLGLAVLGRRTPGHVRGIGPRVSRRPRRPSFVGRARDRKRGGSDMNSARKKMTPVWSTAVYDWALLTDGAKVELIDDIYPLLKTLSEEGGPGTGAGTLEMERRRRASPEPPGAVTIVARDPTGSVLGLLDASAQSVAGLNHILEVNIGVAPAVRGRGVGHALLRGAAGFAVTHGQTHLRGWTADAVPAGGAFCHRLDADVLQVVRERRLDLFTVDRANIGRLTRQGAHHALGYDLLFVSGAIPEALQADSRHLLHELLDAAPVGGGSEAERRASVKVLSAQKAGAQRSGRMRWVIYAREKKSGRLVGRTSVGWSADDPTLVGVGGTVVDRAHRGRALGRWMKASMIERVMAECPLAHFMVTTNAAGNAAIGKINEALGFVPGPETTYWEVSLDRLRAHL